MRLFYRLLNLVDHLAGAGSHGTLGCQMEVLLKFLQSSLRVALAQ